VGGGEQPRRVLGEGFLNPVVSGSVPARHQRLRGKEGQDLSDQVRVDQGHAGQSPGEGDSPVTHHVYREEVPEGGRGPGALPAQGEVDRLEALGVGPWIVRGPVR